MVFFIEQVRWFGEDGPWLGERYSGAPSLECYSGSFERISSRAGT